MPPEQWNVEKRSPACAGCAKGFVPGDVYFGALYQEGEGQEEAEGVVRKDYCPECWKEKRGGGEFSFWKGVVPEPEEEDARKKRLDARLDSDALLDCLRTMEDSPDPARRRFRFAVALLLMRKRRLKLLKIARGPLAEDGGAVLVLAETGRGKRARYEIADVKLSEGEIGSLQEEVGRLLGRLGPEAEG